RRGAACPGPILDTTLRAERLAHLLAGDAGEEIVAPAGRVGHHQRDRTAGVVLSVGGDRDCHCKQRECDKCRDTAPLSPPRRRGPTCRVLAMTQGLRYG